MSVFGGDSWAREAHHRKRRVDDLMRDHQNENHSSSSYKKLSNGKYACLVCPNNPLLDSSLLLSMHSKGSRHIAAASRLKERELSIKEEINKRLALSDGSNICTSLSSSSQRFSKPLIEQTWKATSEALQLNVEQVVQTVQCSGEKSRLLDPKPLLTSKQKNEPSMFKERNGEGTTGEFGKMLLQRQMELNERRQKELKFIEAGWKRDCYGGWFKDENVEFDSDEEDPNVVLL